MIYQSKISSKTGSTFYFCTQTPHKSYWLEQARDFKASSFSIFPLILKIPVKQKFLTIEKFTTRSRTLKALERDSESSGLFFRAKSIFLTKNLTFQKSGRTSSGKSQRNFVLNQVNIKCTLKFFRYSESDFPQASSLFVLCRTCLRLIVIKKTGVDRNSTK